MKPALARLALAALLFVCWIGYLVYQVLTLPPKVHGQPVVLSRPQLLVSDLDVIADVPELHSRVPVTVDTVLYPESRRDQLEGKTITVTNLEQCRALPRGPGAESPPDWTGPGQYLLPLRRSADDTYEVVPIPASPGYPPNPLMRVGPPRIYPANPQILAQYRKIPKPK